MSRRKKRAYVRQDNSRHRIVPVWKDAFDEKEFARILLLLAMHLDETKPVVHNKGQKSGDGGGHHG